MRRDGNRTAMKRRGWYNVEDHKRAFVLWRRLLTFRAVSREPGMPDHATLIKWSRSDYPCRYGCPWHGWEGIQRRIQAEVRARLMNEAVPWDPGPDDLLRGLRGLQEEPDPDDLLRWIHQEDFDLDNLLRGFQEDPGLDDLLRWIQEDPVPADLLRWPQEDPDLDRGLQEDLDFPILDDLPDSPGGGERPKADLEPYIREEIARLCQDQKCSKSTG